MSKLTDVQLVALSSAAARDDAAASRPPKMTNAAASKLAASLVGLKLMREVLSKPGMPVWRAGEDGRDHSLVILRAGRDAIGVTEERGMDQPATAEVNPPNASAKPGPSAKPARRRAQPGGAVAFARDEVATVTPADEPEQSETGEALVDALADATKGAPRSGTKQAMVVAMLTSDDGVTLHALVEATGWLPHTTRAALTGLRKRGMAITREKQASGVSVYRVRAEPAVSAAA